VLLLRWCRPVGLGLCICPLNLYIVYILQGEGSNTDDDDDDDDEHKLQIAYVQDHKYLRQTVLETERRIRDITTDKKISYKLDMNLTRI